MSDDFVGPPIDLPSQVLNRANRDVGVHEEPKGSNSGPRVNQYLATVHLPPGNAWCAAACSTWVTEAAHDLGVKLHFRTSGSAMHLLSLNPHLVVTDPQPGDLMIFDHGAGKGHAVVVETVGAQIGTIEPNSDPGGSREGWIVCRRHRAPDDPKLAGYIRVA